VLDGVERIFDRRQRAVKEENDEAERRLRLEEMRRRGGGGGGAQALPPAQNQQQQAPAAQPPAQRSILGTSMLDDVSEPNLAKLMRRRQNPLVENAFEDQAAEGKEDWSPAVMEVAMSEAEDRFDVTLVGRLYGCGAYGCAAPLTDGAVLKATIDVKEVAWATLVHDHPMPGMVRVIAKPAVVAVDDWNHGEYDEDDPLPVYDVHAYVRAGTRNLTDAEWRDVTKERSPVAGRSKSARAAAERKAKKLLAEGRAKEAYALAMPSWVEIDVDAPRLRPMMSTIQAYDRMGYELGDYHKRDNLGVDDSGIIVLRDGRTGSPSEDEP
jgi:hypothetical protein